MRATTEMARAGHNAHRRFLTEVWTGLSACQKSLPCEYFYDATGSVLFEQITGLNEYYPTRTEIAILHAHVHEIAQRTREGTVLVEFGSGSSTKTEILLGACPGISHYVPIDVSPTIIGLAKARLGTLFPALRFEPIFASFAVDFELPASLRDNQKLGFFPGSTIGNFEHQVAVNLLARFREQLGPSARLIVGADLRKSPDILIPAYNDPAGVTAAFNLNLLARINRELVGTFDLGAFEHDATYDTNAGRIDMFLVSRRRQTALVAGRAFEFAAAERVHTEISQKYEVGELQDLARRAGWSVAQVWTDPDQLFSVHEFVSYS